MKQQIQNPKKMAVVKVILVSLCMFVWGSGGLYAQQGTVAAGGVAFGTGGTATYSTGLVSYITATGASGKINQGLQQPSTAVGKFIPGKIEAENWDVKFGPQYAIPTTDDGGGQKVAGLTFGSWMDYNVTVTQTGLYTVYFRVGTPQPNVQFQIKSGANILATINFSNTGEWDIWRSIPVENVPLTAGPQTIRIQLTSISTCNFNWTDWVLTSPSTAPSANAGPSQTVTLPTSEVTLTGSGAANNGGTITWLWTRESGPNTSPSLTIVSPTASTTSVTGLIQGVYVFRLTVTRNDGQTAFSEVTVTVNPFIESTPYGGIRWPIPGRLEAEVYDNGGQNVAYLDGTPVNSGQAFRLTESVDVRSSTDAGAGYCVGWTTDGEWLKFSVNVTTTGLYTFTARIATPNTGKTIQFQVDGTTAGILPVVNTGGFNTWQTVTLNNVSLTAGDHVFWFLFNTGDAGNTANGFDINWFNFALDQSQVSTPYGGIRWPIPGRLEAEVYDNGGQNVAYLDGTPVNSGQAFRLTESVDVRSSTDAGAGYCVGWTTDGEWLKFSVNVTTTGLYTFTARIATPNTGKTIQFQVDGTTAGILPVVNTGGFNTWQTVTLNNVSLTAGDHVFRFLFNTGDAGNTANGFDINWFNFALDQSQVSTPYGGIRWPIPGRLEAEVYDNGGQNVAYLDGTPVNSGQAFRLTESVDVRSSTDAGAGYCVGWTTDGEWLKFSVNVTTTGLYTFTARIATPNTGKSIQFQVDGTTAGILPVVNTGGFNTWQTVTLNNVSLTAGDHVFRFLFNTGDAGNTANGFDINWFNFALGAPPVTTIAKLPVDITTVEQELTAGNLFVSVFPNPTSSYFNLKVQAKSMEAVTIKVFDITGRSVQQLQGTPGQTMRFGDLLVNGTYLVEVRQGSEKVVTKVIKQ